MYQTLSGCISSGMFEERFEIKMSDYKHSFAVCAYGESPYLEACIRSLKAQTVKSEIFIATSTPCEYISRMAEKYGLTVYVNEGEKGITQDWNFALGKVRTRDATIAHQDELYGRHYTENLTEKMDAAKKPLIFFSDYAELRNEKIVSSNRILNIKRLMLIPMKFGFLSSNRFARRSMLSLGDPVCCPSVGFCMENMPEKIFESGFRAAEDWQAWEKLSKLEGDFCFCDKMLMLHRIHEDSETTRVIGDTGRSGEDFEMYRKFWPEPIARFLARAYKNSEKSNSIN